MYTRLLTLLLLPLLALGQSTSSGGRNTTGPSVTPAPSTNSSGSAAQPASTTVTLTSVDSAISFLPGRVQTTVVATHLITTVLPVPTANVTNANSTNTTTTSPTSSAPPVILPTANPSPDGGGTPNGAPSPGAKSPNNAFGPDDGYIAAATTLAKNAAIVSLVGSLVGGAMILI